MGEKFFSLDGGIEKSRFSQKSFKKKLRTINTECENTAPSLMNY